MQLIFFCWPLTGYGRNRERNRERGGGLKIVRVARGRERDNLVK